MMNTAGQASSATLINRALASLFSRRPYAALCDRCLIRNPNRQLGLLHYMLPTIITPQKARNSN